MANFLTRFVLNQKLLDLFFRRLSKKFLFADQTENGNNKTFATRIFMSCKNADCAVIFQRHLLSDWHIHDLVDFFPSYWTKKLFFSKIRHPL